jgi:hypothetical protein
MGVPADRSGASVLVEGLVGALTRHMGPVTLAPTVWLVTGHRLTELSESEQSDLTRHLPSGEGAVIIVGRT